MPRNVSLDPLQSTGMPELPDQLNRWLGQLYVRIGAGPFKVQGYAVASLPDATKYGSTSSSDPFSSLIFVYNETGGATLAFSDGTNWRRVQDRIIVS